MRRFRKLLIFAAMVAVLTCLLCVALNAETYSGTCGKNGDNVTWSLDTATGVLKIEGEGDMADYSLSAPWYNLRSYIKALDISDGITSIGAGAFGNCEHLERITIPASITSISLFAFNNTAWYKNQPDGLVYAGNVAYKYKGTMPSEVSMFLRADTVGIADGTFSGCTNLKSINIPTGVTSIGYGAFYDCTGLMSVTFGENSQLKSIGSGAFRGCTELKSIEIPAGVTAIEESSFGICSNLTSITIPAGVTSIGDNAFISCTSLTSIKIPSSVTSIGNSAFQNCTSLTSIKIPSSVTSIGDYAFGKCYNLESVEIPSTNISSSILNNCGNIKSAIMPAHLFSQISTKNMRTVVINGGSSITQGAFQNCTSLTSVTISNSVTSIGGWAFRDCTGLTSITIPASVTSVGDYAFYGCASLTSITFGENSQLTNMGSYAFYGCASLTSIDIPDGVTNIGSSAFFNCRKLYVVYNNSDLGVVPGGYDHGYVACYAKLVVDKNGNETYSSDASNYHISDEFICKIENGRYKLIAYIGGKNIVELPLTINGQEYDIYEMSGAFNIVVIPQGVTSIGDYAFRGHISLTSITIPDSVTSIGNSAFLNCTGLTSVTFDENSQLAIIGNGAFNGCSDLTSIDIPDGVTSIGGSAFNGCSDLASIDIPDGVTSIEYGAFGGCTGLTSIEIPASVTSIGDRAFSGCTSLASIEIPVGLMSIGHHAFGNCDSLTSVDIPASVSSIGEAPFSWCNNLMNISVCEANTNYKSINGVLFTKDGKLLLTFPAGKSGIYKMPDGVTSIGYGAFAECYKLTSVTISDTVTSIGSSAFFGCTSLANVTIPDSVTGTGIGPSAFSGCTNLTSITIPAGVTEISCNAFTKYQKVTIYSKTVVFRYAKYTSTYDIYGYEGSTAQQAASQYGWKFVAIDKYESVSANATLDENITMNFTATDLSANDFNGSDIKMTFVMNGRETNVDCVEKNGQYVFSFDKIAPQCMGDNIDYTITTDGVAVKQGSISVKGYLELLCQNKPAGMTDNKFEALKTLANDMLNYSSAAQNYTKHSIDNLANSNYYAEIMAKYTALDPESTDMELTGTATSGAAFTSVGVKFDSLNKVFFRFSAEDISKVTVTINGVEVTPQKTNNVYTVYSEDIYASSLTSSVYTAVLTYDGAEVQTLKYSFKSFVCYYQDKTVDGNLTAEAILARATYTYGLSAKAYDTAQ